MSEDKESAKINIEEWDCPCGNCNTEDGYADWSQTCLEAYNQMKE